MLSGYPLQAVASTPRDPTEWVGPGLIGFVVIAALGVATVLLWRNMNKQLRKVRFEEEPDPRSSGSAPRPISDPSPDSGDDSGATGQRQAADASAADGTHRKPADGSHSQPGS